MESRWDYKETFRGIGIVQFTELVDDSMDVFPLWKLIEWYIFCICVIPQLEFLKNIQIGEGLKQKHTLVLTEGVKPIAVRDLYM